MSGLPPDLTPDLAPDLTPEPPLSAAAKRRGGRAMRLRGLFAKEFRQIVRDPSSISVAFVLPVVLLLLFGYGVSLDARHVAIAVVDESRSNDSMAFTASLVNSEYFAPRFYVGRRQAEAAMTAGRVNGIVVLRPDFARLTRSSRGAAIQVILRGTESNTAQIVNGYVEGAWNVWMRQRALDAGRDFRPPVAVKQRVWFNAEMRSRNFLVPGLVAIIMTLIGTLLTALVMAREWERGTMEALMATPVTVGEILLGKLVPYFVLGMGGMALSTVMAIWLFEVPFRGSFSVLLAVSSLFMITALGMGLLISTVARSQFVAGQVAILAAFLPAFILSGFVFDVASMPPVVQALTELIPARHLVSVLQSLFLAGDIWPIIVADSLALVAMAAVFIGATRARTRKRLD